MKLFIPGLKTFVLGRYGSLLLVLTSLFLLQPFVTTAPGKVLLEILFVAALLAGLRAIGIKKGLLRFEVLLLVISLICSYLGTFAGYYALFCIGLAGEALFLALVAISILVSLFQDRKVSGDTLAGAVCCYLLLALVWSYLFMLIEVGFPGSFSFTQGAARMQLWLSGEFYPFFYFSLVTLTTVGYGDMAPVSTAARTMATLEALLGQIYLTILVARLVGMHLVSQDK
ncbi:MAG: potassium channel family protein [Desulfuromonadales bacterium]|nr:potassium channel family protein [Desulfuromonadales bacterium]